MATRNKKSKRPANQRHKFITIFRTRYTPRELELLLWLVQNGDRFVNNLLDGLINRGPIKFK